MGRRPCCSKEGLNRGAWTAWEDEMLTSYIQARGEGNWRELPNRAGLNRCGKSCRLRWLNYLRPDIKRGNISSDEEELIIRLHNLLGNRWTLIAGRLPGRTDNEIKNYWNTILRKRVKAQASSIENPPTKSTHKMLPTESPAVEPDQARKAKIEIIRTRATRLSSSKVMVPLQPPATQDIDVSNLFELRADDQMCSTSNQEKGNDTTLETHHGRQLLDSLYNDDGSDFLNFEINDLPLPFDETMFKDSTTNPCLHENAATDLESLAFWLDNDEWP